MTKPPSCPKHPAWPAAGCDECSSLVADALHKRELTLADLDKSAMVQALENALDAAVGEVLSYPGGSSAPYFVVNVDHIARRYVVTVVVSDQDGISDAGYHNIHMALAKVLEVQRIDASVCVVFR